MKTRDEIIAQLEPIGYGTVPDGWDENLNTRYVEAGFGRHPETGHTIAYQPSPYGQWFFFTLALPPAVDVDEAAWLFDNHPIARKRYTLIDRAWPMAAVRRLLADVLA